MYQVQGYYTFYSDDGAEPLCPTCARHDAHEQGLSLDDRDSYAIIWDNTETDSVEYCSDCGERIYTSLTEYGIDDLRARVLEALKRGDYEEAAEYRDILDEYNVQVEAYAHAVARIGYPLTFVGTPRETYDEAAQDLLKAYAGYPPELIDEWHIDSDPETGEIYEASVDFFGGWYATVEEIDF